MNRFRCPHCRKRLKYADEHEGRKLKCPKCGHSLELLTLDAAPAPARKSKEEPLPRRKVVLRVIAIGLICITVGPGLWALSHLMRHGDNDEASFIDTPPTVDAGKPLPRVAQKPDPALSIKAQAILQKNCYPCHGQDGSSDGGFNFVIDQPRLLATKKIVPGNLQASKVYQRIIKKEMPPEEDDEGNAITQRPNAADVETLKQWIEAGAPAFAPAASPSDFLRPTQSFELMRDDLVKFDERDRKFIRYFTLTHFANAGAAASDIEGFRQGLSKLVNSLSWGRKIVPPKPIDPAQTILRINLNDYDWDEKTWDSVVAQYPFDVSYKTLAAKETYEMTQTAHPVVRGDWFVNTASRPPLYHTILKMPTNDRDLEKELRIDSGEDIRKELVHRAGFNGSGVSQNNRLLERHRTGFGAYWRSYDFANNLDKKNLFQHPLGPGDAPNLFQQDGGEIIFNLPNKLQAYMLIDSKGNRIDKGPLNIVSDPKQKDRAVVNGISCMSCHYQGMIDKNDQIRDAVLKNTESYSLDEVALVKRLYPVKEEFETLLHDDAGRFKKAVEACGAKVTGPEPIEALSLRYENAVDLKLAAAEIGITVDDLLKGLAKAPAALSREFSALRAPGGVVQRDVFASDFQALTALLETQGLLPK